MIHMFGMSTNYAVIVVYPVTVDMTKMPEVNFHVFETITRLEGENTKFYLIDLR